ncbi:MAG: GNAT family N-acetyltransferase [Bacilli bacterium]|nr:GNAT family N-acetyltransferase [Bacilli bacterium]
MVNDLWGIDTVYKYDKNGNYIGYVKPITEFDDFSDVIDVFKEPPYGEPLTMEDKIEEYNGYVDHGLALGYYTPEGEIMGYIGLLEEVEDEHKEYFHESIDKLNPLYVYGVATKSKFRGHGVATTLINATCNHAINENVDFIYCRINHKDSMSEGIFRNNEYTDLYQNGEVVFQDISNQTFRISEETDPEGNLKRFLLKPTTEYGKEFLTLTGSIPTEGKEMEAEKVLVLK